MGGTEILDCHLDGGTKTKLIDGIRRNYQVGRAGLRLLSLYFTYIQDLMHVRLEVACAPGLNKKN